MSARDASSTVPVALAARRLSKPPLQVAVVERVVRELLPDPDGARAFRACYLCTDGEGKRWHIPATMLEWPGGHYQWFPELPPGHRSPGSG